MDQTNKGRQGQDPAAEWGERLEHGKVVARGGKGSGPVPGAQEAAPASPYGPHRGHVDEAAGGADSSSLENLPEEERREAAENSAWKPGGEAEGRAS